MATDATRDKRHVVLARPGDVLLIGNVGNADIEQLQAFREFLIGLGIRCVIFAQDIDIDQLSEGEWAELRKPG